MKKNLVITLLVTVGFIAVSNLCYAQPYPSISFEEWLEKYGAWDQLEKEYSQEQDKDTPEVILKRAQVYLNLNSPEEALEIVEMTPAFDNNPLEARRLWLGGQAHRALGDLSKSVLWFSQASEHLSNEKDVKKHFSNEPGLANIWKDVWLKLYWAYTANYTISKSAQHDALNRICNVGLTVWGGDYWEKAHGILNSDSPFNKKKNPTAPILSENGLPLPPFISTTDKEAVAKGLALVSLEKFDQAHDIINSISQPAVRFFWNEIINFLENGATPESLSPLIDGNYLKATAFWQGNILAPYSDSLDSWLLGNPDSGPWTKFRNNILSMSVDDASKAIDNELGSMLISEQTATLLNSFKLALSISNGDFINSASVWNKIDKKKLPVAIQLAGVLLFKENLNVVLPDNSAKAFAMYPMFVSLTGAAGYHHGGEDEADFWIAAPQKQIPVLAGKKYPLDKLLRLAHWQQIFDSEPSVAFAKRSAFLFDDTSFGTEALLYLANDTVKAKKLQLGAFYLNKINSSSVAENYKGIWLDIKTRLELDSGRNAAALKTFHQMDEEGHNIPVITRLRMALLYQQRREFKAAKQQLMAMWNNRADMSTTLQAETLFWLGEGEQGMRNPETALDYYLRLAWEYPQESIWALTAMYRASLIYEKRGKYDTAKRLLGTVAKRADREEQREAAKARMSAIDRKMGKKTKDKQSESALVYPF
jgi:thioredoxin-like negative regulator of GroEL